MSAGTARRPLRFEVRVQPGASRTEVAGPYGDGVRIRVAAAPAEGAANDELCEFLALQLDVPRSAVRIVRGETSRSKLLEVIGTTRDRVRKLLSG